MGRNVTASVAIDIERKCDECGKVMASKTLLPLGWSSLVRHINLDHKYGTPTIDDVVLCEKCGPVIEIRCDCGVQRYQGDCQSNVCDNDE